MSQETIEARVKQVLSNELCYKIEAIDLDKKLSDDLSADSMDLIMVMVGLEDEFGIDIEDKDIYPSMRVEDVVNLVKNHVNEKVAT